MRFSSADSLSRPIADIRTSIAPSSSNFAILPLPLFCTSRARQDHLGAAKKSFELNSLVWFERSHILDRQLPEPVAQPMQPYPRRPVCDAELIGNFAKGDVTPEADQ